MFELTREVHADERETTEYEKGVGSHVKAYNGPPNRPIPDDAKNVPRDQIAEHLNGLEVARIRSEIERAVDLGMPDALNEGPAAENIRREVQYL